MRRSVLVGILLVAGCTAIQAQETIDGPRNHAFYYEIFGPGLISGSVNYDHLFRIGLDQGVSLRIGMAYLDGPFLIPEVNYLLGNGVHFAEMGIGTSTFFTLSGERGPDLYVRPGYRLQGKRGFHLRVAPVFSTTKGSFAGQILVLPAVSLGYCY